MKNFIKDTEITVLIFSILITFVILLFFLAKSVTPSAAAEAGMVVYVSNDF